ncbi:MAG TPA: NAD(P)/FAD-dependent oxidoreductase [Thermoanaerobaculia bacterium]
MPSAQTTYDAIIVGAGPAGLTCAIFLARYRRRVLVADSGQPRNAASRGIHGFIGHHSIPPAELLARGRQEARDFGAEISDCTVEGIERVGDVFEATTTAGTFTARRIVLAYGVRDELPDIPNIRDYYGVSLFHCPDCDGYECSDKRIGIVGSGKSAAGLALKLLQWSCDLTIFMHGKPRDFDKEMTSKLLAEQITLKDERILALEGEGGRVTTVVLDSGERVPADALFFNVGCTRQCRLAEDLGCEVSSETPNVTVDEYRQTTVEGVYAIGDLVAGAQLVITSAADGAIAAIAINKSLLPPGRLV